MQSLSKSQYCKGRKCLKRIWLYNFRKDLIKDTSTFQTFLFTQGNEVGELARKLYPEGILIHEDYQNFDQALVRTHAEIQNGTKAIFEGAFLFENVAVRVDILLRNFDGSFDLIEVKSNTELKKKEHLPDCAIQAYILKHSGFPIRSVHLAYLNKQYVKKGPLNLSELFIIVPVDDSLESELQLVPNYLAEIKQTLLQDNEPFREIGSICKSPYECEFKHYCWKNISEKSIHFLTGIRDKLRHQLISEDIEFIKDIPESLISNDNQLIQIKSEKTDEVCINRGEIAKHLEHLRYPLYFLDFETIAYAIPRFDGNRPYQKLPFQYSLHLQRAAGSNLEHYEFLFEKDENPMRVLAKQLIQVIGSEGSIVVYNKPFEESCLKELAKEFLDLAPKLNNMIERLWDLMDPFSKKWFYDPRFNGSASIKKVLPVLAPDLTYANLGIQQGDDALAKYLSYINEPLSVKEREKIKNDLLEYCKLDSLAMVRILNELQKHVDFGSI